jgi:uncharacterized membrane protein YeaQ/YmgE (transglycosylase-associated protein family)
MLGTILAWIIIGGIAGWLASLLVRGGGMGIGMDIIVGIVGGIIGGFLLGLLGLGGGFGLWEPFSIFPFISISHGMTAMPGGPCPERREYSSRGNGSAFLSHAGHSWRRSLTRSEAAYVARILC